MEVFSYTNDETRHLNTVGRLFVVGEHDGAAHYVLNGQVVQRPASPVTLVGSTLYDVPAGSTVWCDGQGYPAEGDVKLEFPLPGTFQVRVERFPYLDWTAEVTA